MPTDAATTLLSNIPTFGETTLRAVRSTPPPLTEARIAAIIDAQLARYLAANHPAKPVSATSKAGTNIPPTPQEVTAYSASIGYPLDGQSFCDSYEVKGWLVGKVKMKNWQAAVRNWKMNRWGKVLAIDPATNVPAKDYSKF